MSKRLPATLCHRVLDGSFALFGTLNSKLSGLTGETNKRDKLSISQAEPDLPTHPLRCNATDGAPSPLDGPNPVERGPER